MQVIAISPSPRVMICGDSIRWETRQPPPLHPSNFFAQNLAKKQERRRCEEIPFSSCCRQKVLDYISFRGLTGMDFCYRRHQSGSSPQWSSNVLPRYRGWGASKKSNIYTRGNLSSKISPKLITILCSHITGHISQALE